MRVPLLASLPLALALCARPAAAQQPILPLEEGERIRLAAPVLDPGLVNARVAGVGADWIAFRLDGEESVYTRRLEFVDRVAVRRERSLGQRALRGAAWGLFLGGSAGGMSAPFIAYGLDSEVDDWQAVGTGAGAGAVLGSALGALVGIALPSRYWQLFEIVPAR